MDGCVLSHFTDGDAGPNVIDEILAGTAPPDLRPGRSLLKDTEELEGHRVFTIDEEFGVRDAIAHQLVTLADGFQNIDAGLEGTDRFAVVTLGSVALAEDTERSTHLVLVTDLDAEADAGEGADPSVGGLTGSVKKIGAATKQFTGQITIRNYAAR